MKTKMIMFAIIAMIAVIGVGFAACVINDNGGDKGNKNEGTEETGTKTESETDVIVPECFSHTYGDWNVIANATSDEDGEEKRTCGVCGHAQTKTIPATGNPDCLHEYGEWGVKKEAACTDEGEKERTCIMCPKSEIEAIGHAPLSWTTKPGYRACPNTGCDSAAKVELSDAGPAGGIIFYISTEGFTVEGFIGTEGSFDSYTAYYLEAAPANEGSSILWGASGTLITGVTTFTSGSDSKVSLIGNGRKDTQIIVNHLSTTIETGRAAQVCASKSLNGFSDWFLPSLGELNEMYKAKTHLGISSGWFWSSSQGNGAFYVWIRNFGTGNQDNIDKNSNGNVRAVRAF